MRGPLLLALVCTWVSTAAAAVTLAATPSTELPLAARFAPELKRRSSKALIKFAEAAIGRFLLDEQEFAVDTTTDIADLIVAATSLEILLTRKDQPAQVAVLATRAASVLHRLGWVYDNDRGLRGRMATLVKKAKGKAAKTSSTQMRDSMKNTAGSLLEPSAAFRPLRDQTASTWRGMHARRAHYEAEIFPALDTAGVARETLQIAWDFTTQSEADATGLGVAMRSPGSSDGAKE